MKRVCVSLREINDAFKPSSSPQETKKIGENVFVLNATCVQESIQNRNTQHLYLHVITVLRKT